MAKPKKVRKVDLVADEFIAACAGEMTMGEFGLYCMVNFFIYSRRKAIPHDTDWLRGKFKRSPELRHLDRNLAVLIASGRVSSEDGLLMVSRAADELQSARSRIAASRQNGRSGGRPPSKNKGVTKPGGFDGEKLSPTPTPSSSPKEEPPKPPEGGGSDGKPDGLTADDPPKVPAYPKDFEAWWAVYPEKVGKDAALKAWEKRRKAHTLPTLEILIEATRRYIAVKPQDRAWCNPSTWLNQGRWMDAPAETAPGADAAPADPPPDLSGWRLAAFKGEGKAAYESWIAPAEVRRSGGTITAKYPTKFMVSWVRTHFADKLLRWMKAEDLAIERVVIEQAQVPAGAPGAPPDGDDLDIPGFLKRETAQAGAA